MLMFGLRLGNDPRVALLALICRPNSSLPTTRTTQSKDSI
jgi:hypothetical protein